MWNKKDSKIDRRNLIKSVGVAGLGGVLSAAGVSAADANKPDANEPNAPTPPPKPEKIPTRKLGKTGAEVPVLSLGFGRPGDLVVLRQAIDWGVYHWDTSFVAGNGTSEQSIGDFLTKNPDVRKQLFIVSKESKSKTAEDLENCLQTSLKRLNTSYIDFYCGVYMMSDPAQLTDEVRKWAEDAKKRGVIKYFGFSLHENMAKCLSAAAKLDWIDAIQTKYDFRLMQDKQLQESIEACNKAGIGLIAMKTQSMRPRGAVAEADAEADKKMIAHFLQKGFTEGQAKIKAVLEDNRISSVCSAMSSTAMLYTNIAAVLDKTTLAAEDMEVLRQYAQDTCSGYCAGCADICQQAASGVPVSDIMRALVYHDSYGDVAEARALFAAISDRTRQQLLSIDYNAAESLCPNRMPIGKLVADAVSKLG